MCVATATTAVGLMGACGPGSVQHRPIISMALACDASCLAVQDVAIASGCSGALELAISVLLNPGDNVLLPQPAFSLYETLIANKGGEVRHYRLLPDRSWEADLSQMESLIDHKCVVPRIPPPA